jgi:hypothetical protein
MSDTNICFLKASFLFVSSIILFSSCNKISKNKSEDLANQVDTAVVKPVSKQKLLFGILSDSFNVIPGRIKPDRFLSDILTGYGITLQEIDQLIKNSSSVFDVRDIRSDHNYTLLLEKDSNAKARYFIYEHDPSVFYIFSFNDTLNITPFRQEARSVIRFFPVQLRPPSGML